MNLAPQLTQLEYIYDIIENFLSWKYVIISVIIELSGIMIMHG